MPQPVKAETKEPEVRIIPSETPQEPEKIQIDATTGEPIQASAPVTPSVSPDELKKFQARMEYQSRQNERIQAQLNEALQRLNQPTQPARPAEKPESPDDFDPELDAIAKNNYQRYTKIQAQRVAEEVSEKKFKSMMDDYNKQQQQVQQKQRTASDLEREKNWVVQRTPALADETSEEFRGYYTTYNRMLADNPSLVTNPLAPRLIWYEWQASNGEKVTAPAQTESARQARVAAAATPQGRSVSTQKKTYQLTPDEIQLCKDNKLSPARYAQMKEANFKEGVTA